MAVGQQWFVAFLNGGEVGFLVSCPLPPRPSHLVPSTPPYSQIELSFLQTSFLCFSSQESSLKVGGGASTSIPAASTPGRGSVRLPAPRGQGDRRLGNAGPQEGQEPGRGPSGSHAGPQAPGAEPLVPAPAQALHLDQAE